MYNMTAPPPQAFDVPLLVTFGETTIFSGVLQYEIDTTTPVSGINNVLRITNGPISTGQNNLLVEDDSSAPASAGDFSNPLFVDSNPNNLYFIQTLIRVTKTGIKIGNDTPDYILFYYYTSPNGQEVGASVKYYIANKDTDGGYDTYIVPGVTITTGNNPNAIMSSELKTLTSNLKSIDSDLKSLTLALKPKQSVAPFANEETVVETIMYDIALPLGMWNMGKMAYKKANMNNKSSKVEQEQSVVEMLIYDIALPLGVWQAGKFLYKKVRKN